MDDINGQIRVLFYSLIKESILERIGDNHYIYLELNRKYFHSFNLYLFLAKKQKRRVVSQVNGLLLTGSHMALTRVNQISS